MQSVNILFTGVNEVEVRAEEVAAPGEGQVLIQASRSLISTGTEGICLGRLFAPGTHWDRWVRYPFHPGYSTVGTVIAVGPGVETLREGDRVAAATNHKQYALAQAATVYPVPAGLSDEDAAWFHLAYITQIGVRRAEHILGEDVALVGLGLLGQLVTQYVRLMGARQIIAIDPAEKRLQLAQAHGATTILAQNAADARATVLDQTEGLGVHVVYDITGIAAAFPSALQLLRNYGRLILLGDTGNPGAQQLTGDVVTRGLRIIGSHDSNAPRQSTEHAYWDYRRMVELFYTYLLRGDMRVHDLVTHRYAPQEAPESYRMLREERASAMGVIFDWSRL